MAMQHITCNIDDPAVMVLRVCSYTVFAALWIRGEKAALWIRGEAGEGLGFRGTALQLRRRKDGYFASLRICKAS